MRQWESISSHRESLDSNESHTRGYPIRLRAGSAGRDGGPRVVFVGRKPCNGNRLNQKTMPNEDDAALKGVARTNGVVSENSPALELTLRFEPPVSAADLRERFEALACRMADVEAEAGR